MIESTMTYTELSDHAFKGAAEYLQMAIRHVDTLDGWGGAKQNPALVAALVQASAVEFLSLMVSHRAVPALSDLTGRVGDIADIAGGVQGK